MFIFGGFFSKGKFTQVLSLKSRPKGITSRKRVILHVIKRKDEKYDFNHIVQNLDLKLELYNDRQIFAYSCEDKSNMVS